MLSRSSAIQTATRLQGAVNRPVVERGGPTVIPRAVVTGGSSRGVLVTSSSSSGPVATGGRGSGPNISPGA